MMTVKEREFVMCGARKKNNLGVLIIVVLVHATIDLSAVSAKAAAATVEAPTVVVLPPDSPELLAKIKQRLFAGGADEEDLQVQTPLERPQRKMFAVQEEAEELESID